MRNKIHPTNQPTTTTKNKQSKQAYYTICTTFISMCMRVSEWMIEKERARAQECSNDCTYMFVCVFILQALTQAHFVFDSLSFSRWTNEVSSSGSHSCYIVSVRKEKKRKTTHTDKYSIFLSLCFIHSLTRCVSHSFIHSFIELRSLRSIWHKMGFRIWQWIMTPYTT